MAPTTETDPAIAAKLVGMERYNPSNIDILEAFVDTQCANGSYDLDANLALLKLYQFNPAQTNIDIIAKILIKALMQLPANDFAIYLQLLNDQVLEFEPLPLLVQLQDYLETAQFAKFWTHAKELTAYSSMAMGFDDAIRKAISVTVSITFQTVQKATLAEAFDLQGAALSDYIKQLGWTEDASGLVTIPLNEENQPKLEPTVTPVQFEQLTKLIGSVE